MDKGKKVVGVAIIVISIIALITWEKWGKNKFLYSEILVFRDNVNKGTIISEEMFLLKRIDSEEDDVLTEKNIKQILGMECSQFVHKNTPLFKEYFQLNGLVANEKDDKYYMSISSDNVESIPVTLAVGDKVFFYLGKKFVTSALVSYVDEDYKKFEIVVNSQQASAMSRIIDNGNKVVVVYN